MFGSKRRTRIRNSIYFLIVIFTTLTICLIGLITYVYIIHFYRDNLDSYMSESSRYCKANLQSITKRINIQSLEIINDQKIYSYISDSRLNEEEKENAVCSIVREKLEIMDIVEKADIITKTGKRYSVSKTENFSGRVDEEFITSNEKYNLYLCDESIKNDDGEQFVVFGKLLINYYTGVEAGKVLFYVREAEVSSAYEDLVLDEDKLFIVNNNTILSATDKNMIGNFADESYFNIYKENKNRFYNMYLVDLGGIELKIISVISHKHLNDSLKIFFGIIVGVVICICFGVIIAAYFISENLIKSAENLKKQMAKYIDGEQIEFEYRNDEIGELEQRFKELTVEIDELIRKNDEEKQRQRKLELAALQAQINPHFTYNAINIIRSMAIINDEKTISEACIALSEFFRISLNCGEDVVTVRDEMKHTQSYVEIERLRFPDKFNVLYNIPAEILDIPMLKILIQPLVENSIKHGFKNIGRKGIIRINAYTDRDFLVFVVSDNGVGMKKNPLDAECERTGYGIFNVNERIQLHYGSDCGIHYEEEPGGGTRAIVKIKRITH